MDEHIILHFVILKINDFFLCVTWSFVQGDTEQGNISWRKWDLYLFRKSYCSLAISIRLEFCKISQLTNFYQSIHICNSVFMVKMKSTSVITKPWSCLNLKSSLILITFTRNTFPILIYKNKLNFSLPTCQLSPSALSRQQISFVQS